MRSTKIKVCVFIQVTILPFWLFLNLYLSFPGPIPPKRRMNSANKEEEGVVFEKNETLCSVKVYI